MTHRRIKNRYLLCDFKNDKYIHHNGFFIRSYQFYLQVYQLASLKFTNRCLLHYLEKCIWHVKRRITPVLFSNTINSILGSDRRFAALTEPVGLKELENTLHHHPKLLLTHYRPALEMFSFPCFVFNQNRVVFFNPYSKYISWYVYTNI